MHRILYNLSILAYGLTLHLAARLGHRRARAWVTGRVKTQIPITGNEERPIWFHMASAGEYEQAVPYLADLKERGIDNVVISFFSPSGYEMYRRTNLARNVFYLPLDTPGAARELVENLNPSAVFFVKNELWWNVLTALREKDIPAFLLNTRLPESFPWFNPWKRLKRTLYGCFDIVFILPGSPEPNIPARLIKGPDARALRARELTGISYSDWSLPESWKDKKIIILGSSYPKEEEILFSMLKKRPGFLEDFRFIVVPHETGKTRVADILNRCPFPATSFRDVDGAEPVIVVNEKGHLKFLYRYACGAFIGGGFRNGLHNILEAAAYGIPVCFGPHYHGDISSADLLQKGIAAVIRDADEFADWLGRILPGELRQETRELAKAYFDEHTNGSIGGVMEPALRIISQKSI